MSETTWHEHNLAGRRGLVPCGCEDGKHDPNDWALTTWVNALEAQVQQLQDSESYYRDAWESACERLASDKERVQQLQAECDKADDEATHYADRLHNRDITVAKLQSENAHYVKELQHVVDFDQLDGQAHEDKYGHWDWPDGERSTWSGEALIADAALKAASPATDSPIEGVQ